MSFEPNVKKFKLMLDDPQDDHFPPQFNESDDDDAEESLFIAPAVASQPPEIPEIPPTQKQIFIDVIFRLHKNGSVAGEYKLECDINYINESDSLEYALNDTDDQIKTYFNKFWKLERNEINNKLQEIENRFVDLHQPHIVPDTPFLDYLTLDQISEIIFILPDFFDDDDFDDNHNFINEHKSMETLMESYYTLELNKTQFWPDTWMTPGSKCIIQLQNNNTVQSNIPCLLGANDNTEQDSSIEFINEQYLLGERYFKVVCNINLNADFSPSGHHYYNILDHLGVYHRILENMQLKFWNTWTPPKPGKMFPSRKYIPTRLVVDSTHIDGDGRPDTQIKPLNNNRSQESITMITNRVRKNPPGTVVESPDVERQMRTKDMTNLFQRYAQ